MYTIAPAHQDGHVRRVHQTELKSALRREELDVQPVSPVHKVEDSVPVAVMSDSEEESMMVVLEGSKRREPGMQRPATEKTVKNKYHRLLLTYAAVLKALLASILTHIGCHIGHQHKKGRV